MDKNTVKNEETKVPNTKEMNDKDFLNDILLCLKNISNNYSIAIDEMSNTELYDEIFEIFNDTKEKGREAYELAFKNGWYSLEKAEEQKITNAYDKLNKQEKEL